MAHDVNSIIISLTKYIPEYINLRTFNDRCSIASSSVDCEADYRN